MISICERVDKLIKDNKPLQIRIGNQWIDFNGETYELLKFHRADIREKPEKEFILGDWWIPWTNSKPEKLTLENIMYYNGTKPYAQNTNAKLWHPKVGEWCWFWDKHTDIAQSPRLAQFHLIVEELQEPIDVPAFHQTKYKATKLGYLYDFCEPFIGQLPTHLKDQS